MRVVSADTSVRPVVVLEVQLQQGNATNEVWFNREVKNFIRKQRAQKAQEEHPPMHIKEESDVPASQDASRHAEHTDAGLSLSQRSLSRAMESPEPEPMRAGRYNDFISRLEKKYCGGLESDEYTNQYSAGEEENSRPATAKKKRGRAPDDDYDLDDPFIDDSDVLDMLEQQRRLSKAKTKHGGFFASAGKLEVHEAEASDSGAGAPKKRRATEMSVAESQALEAFQSEVTAVFGEQVSMEKRQRSFPKRLDEHLRTLDKAFTAHAALDAQVPYLDRLVEIMPLAKNTIKSAVLRLRYQDRAHAAKQAYENTKQQLREEVAKASSNSTTTAASSDEQENSRLTSDSGPPLLQESVNGPTEDRPASANKPRGVWNRTIAQLAVSTVRAYEEWREYEIKRSKVMRSEDKKELSQGEPDDVPAESAVYEEMASFWPANTMDASTLRELTQKQSRSASEAGRKKADGGGASKSGDGKDSRRKSAPAGESSQLAKASVTPAAKKAARKPDRKSLPPKSDSFQLPATFDPNDFDSPAISNSSLH